MRRDARNRFVLVVVAVLAATTVFAFQPIPKASAKALGVTRGKPFSSGAVFVNGKFLPPPYVVERWGTGIRINSVPVTGQVVEWDEFLKTQPGVKVERKEEPAAPAPEAAVQPVQASAPAAETSTSSDDLDDLFEDEPKKTSKSSTARKPPVERPVVASKPKASVVYSIEGDFVPNDASKTLVARINAARTVVDKVLRSGGFICFGDRYSRVTGDRRTLLGMLKELPNLQMRATDLNSFLSGVRSSGLVYLNEPLCADLFRNRVDYRKLQEYYRRLHGSQELNRMLNDSSGSIF